MTSFAEFAVMDPDEITGDTATKPMPFVQFATMEPEGVKPNYSGSGGSWEEESPYKALAKKTGTEVLKNTAEFLSGYGISDTPEQPLLARTPQAPISLSDLGGLIPKSGSLLDLINPMAKGSDAPPEPEPVPNVGRPSTAYERGIEEQNKKIEELGQESQGADWLSKQVAGLIPMIADPSNLVGMRAAGLFKDLTKAEVKSLGTKVLRGMGEGATFQAAQAPIQATREPGREADALVEGLANVPVAAALGGGMEAGVSGIQAARSAIQKISKNYLFTPQGIAKFAEDNPGLARKLAGIENPSRSDLEGVFGKTARLNEKDRSTFSAGLKEYMTSPEARVPLTEPKPEIPNAAGPDGVIHADLPTPEAPNFDTMHFTELQAMAQELGIKSKGTREGLIRDIKAAKGITEPESPRGLTGQELDQYTYSELQALAKEFGVKSKGTRQSIVQGLKEKWDNPEPGTPNGPSDAPPSSGEVIPAPTIKGPEASIKAPGNALPPETALETKPPEIVTRNPSGKAPVAQDAVKAEPVTRAAPEIPEHVKPLVEERAALQQIIQESNDKLKTLKGASRKRFESQLDGAQFRISMLDREIKAGMEGPPPEPVKSEPSKGLLKRAVSRLEDAIATADQELADTLSKSPAVFKAVQDGKPAGMVELPAEIIAKLVKSGALRVAKGAVKFADWSIEMTKVLGDKVKSIDLDDLYQKSVRHYIDNLGPELGHDPNKPMPKYAGSINLTKYPETEFKKFALDVYANNKEAIDAQRRETRTWDQSEEAAKVLGISKEKAMKIKAGTALNTGEMQGVAWQYERTRNKTKELAAKYLETNSNEDLMAYAKELADAGVLQANVSGTRTEIGRALNYLKKVNRNTTKDEKAFDALIENAKKTETILDDAGERDRLTKIAENLRDLEGQPDTIIDGYLNKARKATTMDKIHEAWLASILTGKALVVNPVSNTLFHLTRVSLGKTAEAAIEVPASIIGRRKRAIFFREIPEAVIGSWEGAKQGVLAGIKSFQTEKPVIPGDKIKLFGKEFTIYEKKTHSFSGNKVEGSRTPAIGDWYIKIDGKEYAVGGKQIRLSFRILKAQDEFAQSVSYYTAIHELAYRKARSMGGNVSENMRKILQDIPDDISAKAGEIALTQTFNNPLGYFGKAIQRMKDPHGKTGATRGIAETLRILVPFTQTPGNVAKRSMEMTPMNYGRVIYKAIKGDLPGEKLSEELAKPVVGSMIGIATVMLAREGLITGGGPKDEAHRQALYQVGWQPYSMKINGKYYGFDRLEPVGSILGMAADFSDMMDKADDKSLPEMALNMMNSVAKNVSSKTYLQSVRDTLGFLTGDPYSAKKLTKSLAGSIIPSGVAVAARALDDKFRKTNSPLDMVVSRIPGVSDTLYPERTVWGKESERPGGTLSRMFSPVNVSEAKNDPLDLEMNRLDIAKTAPAETIEVDGKKRKLTPKEYDNLTKNSGERAQIMAKKVFESDEYRDMSDDDKKDAIGNAIDRARRIERIRLAPQDKDIVAYIRAYTAHRPTRTPGEKLAHQQKQVKEWEEKRKLAEEELRFFNRDPKDLLKLLRAAQ
jgi:hypothetical protein